MNHVKTYGRIIKLYVAAFQGMADYGRHI